MHKALLALAAMLLSSQLQAASVMKCVDAAGKVTFTQNQNCPRDHALDDVVSAHNAAPSGSSAAVQMADPAKPRQQKSSGQSFVVVGAPPPPQAVEPEIESEPVRTAAPRAPAQPCIKLVDKMISCSRPGKDGRMRGCAQIIKVPVAC